MTVSIATIQGWLSQLGYDPGLIDGIPGPHTEEAVRLFQKDHAPPLKIDGLPGVATQAELRRALGLPAHGRRTFAIGYDLILGAFPHCRRDIAAAFGQIPDEVALAGVDTRLRAAHFLSQVSAETGSLTILEENLHYTAGRLAAIFPRYFHSVAEAAAVVVQGPQAIANRVYGGRLGNTEPNDGWTYRGGGFLQTTGRENYRKIGHELDPAVVRTPLSGLRAALNYWQQHGCAHIADANDATALRRIINGGTNGLATVFSELARIESLI